MESLAREFAHKIDHHKKGEEQLILKLAASNVATQCSLALMALNVFCGLTLKLALSANCGFSLLFKK